MVTTIKLERGFKGKAVTNMKLIVANSVHLITF